MQFYLTSLFFCLATIGFSQTGPGGAHSPTETRFWYKADVLNSTLSDNNNVSAWPNSGGNGTAATASGGARPKFRTNSANTINGYPVIKFNGNNDQLHIADNSDINLSGYDVMRSNVMVFQTENDITSRQVLYEEGGTIRGLNIFIENGSVYVGMWNNNNDGTGAPWGFHFVSAPISANTAYILTTNFEGNSSFTGALTLWINGVLEDQVSGLGYLYPHSGDIGIGAMINGSMFFGVGASNDGYHFDGRIAEFIIYNQALSPAARLLVHNYLSAKYAIGLTAGELFNMDDSSEGDFDHDVAGIGQSSGTDSFLTGQGSGIVQMANPAVPTNNAYLGWGHDNGNLTWNSSSVPAGLDARLNRNWKADLSSLPLGRVDVSFDLTGVPLGAAIDYRILVDLNQNGDYSDDIPLPEGPTISGATLTFQQVDLPPNVPFTLGYSMLLLPVELAEFNAFPSGHDVRIKWRTLSELNNDLFVVERSADGTAWNPIIYVDGAGNSQYQIDYEVLDTNPEAGISYYRLKQMDFSGAHSYSDVVAVNFNLSNELALEVWPNPTTDIITLRSGSDLVGAIDLYNLNGQLVLHLEPMDQDIIEIMVSHLPRGNYILHLHTISESSTINVLLN